MKFGEVDDGFIFAIAASPIVVLSTSAKIFRRFVQEDQESERGGVFDVKIGDMGIVVVFKWPVYF